MKEKNSARATRTSEDAAATAERRFRSDCLKVGGTVFMQSRVQGKARKGVSSASPLLFGDNSHLAEQAPGSSLLRLALFATTID